MIFVVARPHQDKDGNHRRKGEELELSEEQAAPFLKRGQLMTPEALATKQAADAERAKTATYEFHHYERP